jgi:proline-specific peptidase
MVSVTPLSSLPPAKEAYAPFARDGHEYQTFYKTWGDLTDKTKVPLVVIHGGPGLSHDYLLSLADLSTRGTPVVMYDQIGNARSSRVGDSQPASFWTIDLFIDELVNLLEHLKIQDAFDVYGHSWGAILTSEFILRRHPQGLRHFVVANAPASIGLWHQSLGQLGGAMPEDLQKKIMSDKHSADYREAVFAFYARHGCRLEPSPTEFITTVDYMLADEVVGNNL